MTNDELERPAMSDLVRFDVGISGGLITSAEGKWVSYASHCASRDALVNVVDAQANEIERLRQRLVEAEAYERHSRYVKGVGELADRAARVSEIIAYCAQEGNDGEPYDTINAIATGEYSTRGGGE